MDSKKVVAVIYFINNNNNNNNLYSAVSCKGADQRHFTVQIQLNNMKKSHTKLQATKIWVYYSCQMAHLFKKNTKMETKANTTKTILFSMQSVHREKLIISPRLCLFKKMCFQRNFKLICRLSVFYVSW